MKFEERHEFPRPWDAVQRMFSDPRYFEQKSLALGRQSLKILDHESQPQRFRIRFSFEERPGAQLPAFASRFLGERAQAVEVDLWNWTSRSGRLAIELKGVPVKLGAAMQIADTAQGCVNVLRWEIVCAVPLVGARLEKLVAEDIRQKSAADYAASLELLKNY